jgi:hypothetical protein
MPVHSRVTTPSAFATGKTKRVPVPTGDPVYQEDIFSQFYYAGANSNPKRIYNNIDLENKGGLIWIKQVGANGGGGNTPMIQMDTLMGVNKYQLMANSGGNLWPQTSAGNAITSFNTDGFTLGNNTRWNNINYNYISYTFAKQEKFFTLFSYTGGADGAGTTQIAHDLGCTPGMIVVKGQTDDGTGNTSWHRPVVWHRGYNGGDPGHYFTSLSNDAGIAADNGFFPTSLGGPNATNFTVGNNLNVSGVVYNVYMWGHNEAPEDCIFGEEKNKPLVFCGDCPSAPNSTHYPEVDCGMPVQMLMGKSCIQDHSASIPDSWRVADKYRVMRFHENSTYWCFPESIDSEQDPASGASHGDMGYKTAKGFAQGVHTLQNSVFMAIGDSAYRNATLAPPTGTPYDSVNTIANVFNSNFALSPGFNQWVVGKGLSRTLDFFLNKRVSNTSGSGTEDGKTYVVGRFENWKYLRWNSTSNSDSFGGQDGTRQRHAPTDGGWYYLTGNPNVTDSATGGIAKQGIGGGGTWMTSNNAYMFNMTLNTHRKFFDMQNWVGNNTNNRAIYHNLEVEPAMIWLKGWNAGQDWAVYHKSLGLTKQLKLNLTTGKENFSGEDGSLVSIDNEKIVVNGTGTSYKTNQNEYLYAAYIFGEYPGWSKIGSYTGTGNQIDIDCGFTSGTIANGLGSVLIKRADAGSTGDWYMWNESMSTIVTTGGCQFMKMNQIGDQYNLGNTTYINSLTSTGNPASGHISGLRITNTAANPVNVSGGEYIYWVLAATA